MDKPKSSEKIWLNDLAEVELTSLQNDGINPTWEQVCQINHLCQKVESPSIRAVSATGQPYNLNGRVLWPLTVQAAEWFQWISEEVSDESLLLAGLLLAHERGRDEGAFDSLYDIPAAHKSMTEYKQGMAATLMECMVAINALKADSPEGDGSKEDLNTSELIAFLVAETGIEPDVWKCRVSLAYIVDQIAAINLSKHGSDAVKTSYINAEKSLGVALMEIRNGASS